MVVIRRALTTIGMAAIATSLVGCAAALQAGPGCDELNRPDVRVGPNEKAARVIRIDQLVNGSRAWGPTKAVVYVVVDSGGRVKADSTIVCGTSRAIVISQINKSAATMKFEPATRNGVPVRSVYGFFLYFNRDPDPIDVRNRELANRRAGDR